MSHARALLAAFALTLAAGCASRPASPTSLPPDTATTEAEAGELGGDAADDAAEDAGGFGPGGGAVTSEPSDEPKKDEKATTAKNLTTLADALDAFEDEEIQLRQLLGDADKKSGETTTLDANACGSICDALASMKRSSDAICDLAGEDDERCAKARDKLAGNEKRVAGRGCQCSS